MNVVVRTDASLTMGHGHVMRCLVLATALRERGADVSFVCREREGDLCADIAQRGFKIGRLPPGTASWETDADETRAAIAAFGGRPDWLVVDHYALDHRWEAALRDSAGQIMAIDDLADRPHDCDVLLDQNYFANPGARYSALVPVYCSRFFGPEHVLLRQEFRDAKRNAPVRREGVLIVFGGGDPTGQSAVALDAALAFDATLPVTVVVGRNNPHAEKIDARARSLPQVRLVRHTDNMAELMSRAALCLGGGGISTFERLFMELPSIVVATAENQREPLQALADLGCIEYLGDAAKVGKAEWLAALLRWRSGDIAYTPLAVASRTERVFAALQVRLTPFSKRHIESTFGFVQDASLRANFAMGDAPDWQRHVAYWQRKLSSTDEMIFAIESAGEHVGNCGIKPIPHSDASEGWIYLGPAASMRTGTGEVALRRLLRVAFRDLNLPRLFLHVLRNNEAALGLYRKVGFQEATEPVDPRVWGARSAEMCKLVIAK
jgi:UDP-2,4-diacetamido-2,4,6-trideoxy-beta-L-altropyranose hydrolase